MTGIVLLPGGESRRFRSDKASEIVGGETPWPGWPQRCWWWGEAKVTSCAKILWYVCWRTCNRAGVPLAAFTLAYWRLTPLMRGWWAVTCPLWTHNCYTT